MGSRERLWEKYGEAWGWPPEGMTIEDDRKDLARHEREIAAHEIAAHETAAHETCNDAILDEAETELLGCVYIDPPDGGAPPRTDAVVSWWVVDDQVGGALERALDRFVPRWLTETWQFGSVNYSP